MILSISIDVTNTGKYIGAEVIQVYYQDVESSIERPIRELIGFEKVYLFPKETKTCIIPIKTKDLAFYDVITHSWKIEPGIFEILVGNSSRNILFGKKIIITQ